MAARRDGSEAEAAVRFCADGGTVVLAGPAGLTAFREAASPVYAELERDAQSRRLVQRLRAVAASTPAPAPLAACGPAPLAATPADSPENTGDLPEGTYRTERFEEVLVRAGVDPGAARVFDGINDLRVEDGRWHHDTHGADPSDDCGGPYSVKTMCFWQGYWFQVQTGEPSSTPTTRSTVCSGDVRRRPVGSGAGTDGAHRRSRGP